MTGLRALVEAVREARAAKAASKQIFRPGLVAAVRDAEAELATAITPDVLAAVEAVVALGEARAWAKTCAVDDFVPMTSGMADALRQRSDALYVVMQLADRLAARKGE